MTEIEITDHFLLSNFFLDFDSGFESGGANWTTFEPHAFHLQTVEFGYEAKALMASSGSAIPNF